MDTPSPSADEIPNPIGNVSQDFAFADADIHLISSDDCTFKIHSVKLAAASSIFEGMIAQAKTSGLSRNNTLPFYDEEIETQNVIEIFLRILCGRDLKVLTAFNRDHYRCAVHFMQKYECDIALQTLRYSLHAFCDAKWNCKVGIFTIAAMLDEVEVCSKMLRWGGPCAWGDTNQFGRKSDLEPDVTERPIAGKSIFDISALPRSMAQDIPWAYDFALTRAQTIHRGGVLVKADWNAIVSDFEVFLKPAIEQCPDIPGSW